jgi:thymidylate synthase (FAD)
MVRHRLMSVQQESQRFVSYEDEEPELLFYQDPALSGASADADFWDSVETSLRRYESIKASGVPKQIARYVLPNATRVRMVLKANIREWRHILKLRMHKSAQPEMQLVANQIHDLLLPIYPTAMKDIRPALEAGERAAR